jgi:hypothetical protein
VGCPLWGGGCDTFLLPCFLPIRFWFCALNFHQLALHTWYALQQTFSSNLQHTLDATLCTFSSNLQHALDAMLLTCSCEWQHALDATLLTFWSSWQHALDATLLSFFSFFFDLACFVLRCGEGRLGGWLFVWCFVLYIQVI